MQRFTESLDFNFIKKQRFTQNLWNAKQRFRMNLDLPHFKAEVHTEPWPKVHREPWQRCRGSPRTSGHIDFFLIFQGKNDHFLTPNNLIYNNRKIFNIYRVAYGSPFSVLTDSISTRYKIVNVSGYILGLVW